MCNTIQYMDIARCAEQTPDKIALVDEARTMCYRELYEKSRALAEYLQDRGVEKGDYVLSALTNGTEFAVVYLAALALHAVLLSVNPRFGSRELAFTLESFRAKAAFYNTEQLEQALRQDGRIPLCIRAEWQNEAFAAMTTPRRTSFSCYDSADTDVCTAIYTSGSTGTPKYVARSYRAQYLISKFKIDRMRQNADDVLLVSLPMCQSFGQIALQMGLMTGSTVVLMKKFRAEEALDCIQAHRVSVLFGVPTMYLRLLRAYRAREHKPELGSLRCGIIAGDVSECAYIPDYETLFGCRLLNNYGLTETGTLCVPELDDPASVRYETCGRALSGVELRIVREDGNECAAGQTGEILCRTPGLMRGYLADGRQESWDAEHWFATGDLGNMDEAGNLRVVGRKKDLIIRGGYNVIPAEVERMLLTHPDVLEVCVVAEPDAELGQRICAFVRAKKGSGLDAKALSAYSARQLAAYKRPDRWIFCEELPKLQTEKYDKKALLRRLRDETDRPDETRPEA